MINKKGEETTMKAAEEVPKKWKLVTVYNYEFLEWPIDIESL